MVIQLLAPLKFLSALPDVAELFKAAEMDRKAVQEMVAAEMDILYVQSPVQRGTSMVLLSSSHWLTLSSFRQDPNRPPDLGVARDVCLVIDALGGDFKYVSTLPL